MMHILLFIILAAGIYCLWKWTMGRYNRMRDRFQARPGRPAGGDPKGGMSELVQDPVCKLYIAKDKAIFYKDRYFCSEKCRGEFRE